MGANFSLHVCKVKNLTPPLDLWICPANKVMAHHLTQHGQSSDGVDDCCGIHVRRYSNAVEDCFAAARRIDFVGLCTKVSLMFFTASYFTGGRPLL